MVSSIPSHVVFMATRQALKCLQPLAFSALIPIRAATGIAALAWGLSMTVLANATSLRSMCRVSNIDRLADVVGNTWNDAEILHYIAGDEQSVAVIKTRHNSQLLIGSFDNVKFFVIVKLESDILRAVSSAVYHWMQRNHPEDSARAFKR